LNDTAAGANVSINSFQNPNNFGRFRVWKDKFLNFSNVNMAGSPTTADVIQSGLTMKGKFSFKFGKGGIPVHFNATNGGTVADIVDNSFHVICFANNIVYAPNLNYYTRVSYKE